MPNRAVDSMDVSQKGCFALGLYTFLNIRKVVKDCRTFWMQVDLQCTRPANQELECVRMREVLLVSCGTPFTGGAAHDADAHGPAWFVWPQAVPEGGSPSSCLRHVVEPDRRDDGMGGMRAPARGFRSGLMPFTIHQLHETCCRRYLAEPIFPFAFPVGALHGRSAAADAFAVRGPVDLEAEGPRGEGGSSRAPAGADAPGPCRGSGADAPGPAPHRGRNQNPRPWRPWRPWRGQEPLRCPDELQPAR